MVKAMYPGTFDPPTNGHVDVAVRSSRIFDRVTVAVYDAPPKTLLFSTQERVELFRRSLEHLPAVEVMPFHGLAVQAAHQWNAQVLIRGLRAGGDFDNEFEMALMNKKLAPDVEAVYLMTNLEWQFLSSTRVKEVAQLGGDVTGLVPPHVAVALYAKLRGSAPKADR